MTITKAQFNRVKKLSKRTGNKVCEKFNHEAERFLNNLNCKCTKELLIGKRYENGPFEMIWLGETDRYYFVSQS